MSTVGDRPGAGYGVRRGPDPEVPALERITLASPDGLEVAFVPRAGMVGTSMTLDGVELLGRRARARRPTSSTARPSASRCSRPGPTACATPRAVRRRHDVDRVARPPPASTSTSTGSRSTVCSPASTGSRSRRSTVDGDRAVLRARLHFGPHLDRFAAFPFEHDLVVEAEVWGLTLHGAHVAHGHGRRACPGRVRLAPLRSPSRTPRARCGRSTPPSRGTPCSPSCSCPPARWSTWLPRPGRWAPGPTTTCSSTYGRPRACASPASGTR